LSYLEVIFDLDQLNSELEEISKLANQEDLWNNPDNAKSVLQEKETLQKKIDRFNSFQNSLNEEKELIEMAALEEDEELQNNAFSNLKNLEKKIELFKVEALFNGEADNNNAFLEINPGAGGTESQDWAEMLLRMYLRWVEKKDFKVEIIDDQKGDEAGIKSATLKISGENAYGWLKNESGVHRLVRISPFNSNGKRMTSFASVWTYPEIDENINITIEDKDIRLDTYRASGAGGQHINKTDSAIRITHLETGIAVQCQSSRSQHRNKAEAFKMLKSRLYELELRKKQEATDASNSNKTEIGWGHQIRSYVLQPYQMVKDLRSNYETSGVSNVLDGDLDQFMISLLAN
jgi:peptide chain release factor 2